MGLTLLILWLLFLPVYMLVGILAVFMSSVPSSTRREPASLLECVGIVWKKWCTTAEGFLSGL